MATTAGVNVVTNNLIFYIDFGNSKSWDNTQNYARNMVQQNPVNMDLIGGSSIVTGNYMQTNAENSHYGQAGRVIAPGTGAFSVGFIYRIINAGGRGGLFERANNNTSPSYPGWSLGQGGDSNWAVIVCSDYSTGNKIEVEYTYPSTNIWYYDSFSYSGSGTTANLNIYRNGEFVGSDSDNVGNMDVLNRIPLLIGNRDLVTSHTIDVQLVQIYDKELTATEIKQNYDALAHRL